MRETAHSHQLQCCIYFTLILRQQRQERVSVIHSSAAALVAAAVARQYKLTVGDELLKFHLAINVKADFVQGPLLATADVLTQAKPPNRPLADCTVCFASCLSC